MGLDMYIQGERFIAGHAFSEPETRAQFNNLVTVLGYAPEDLAAGSPYATVTMTFGYWRKANAIHNWFVQNVQGGVDECQKSYVTREHLTVLRTACADILETVELTGTDEMDHWVREVVKIDADKANELLPPKQGFFFGEYELDSWYVQNLRNTVTIIDRIQAMPPEKTGDLYYQSSW